MGMIDPDKQQAAVTEALACHMKEWPQSEGDINRTLAIAETVSDTRGWLARVVFPTAIDQMPSSPGEYTRRRSGKPYLLIVREAHTEHRNGMDYIHDEIVITEAMWKDAANRKTATKESRHDQQPQ